MSRGAVLACLVLAAAVPATALADAYRDPTRPPAVTGRVVAAAGPPGLQFGGVIIADGRRVALLNGRAVQAGDEVGGVTVIDVLPDGVRVSRAGRIEVLHLKRATPRVKSAAKENLQ